MDKILDYLNNRNFETNTIHGAETATRHLLRNEPKRLAHTLGVVNQLKRLLAQTQTSSEFNADCMQAAYLHDVGYSTDFAFSHFHPYDGYFYLRENGWKTEICEAVLFHTFARSLVDVTHPELKEIYRKFHPSEKTNAMIEAVTIADIHTSPNGEFTTVAGRLSDIATRYGPGHPITQHFMDELPNIQMIIAKWPELKI